MSRRRVGSLVNPLELSPTLLLGQQYGLRAPCSFSEGSSHSLEASQPSPQASDSLRFARQGWVGAVESTSIPTQRMREPAG